MVEHYPDSIDDIIDQTVKPFYRKITSEKLHILRNLALAAAGTAMVLLLATSQLKGNSLFITVALASLSSAIPLFVGYAMIVENRILGGPECYEHFSQWISKPQSLIFMITPYLVLILGISSLIYHMSTIAGWLFIGTSVLVSLFNRKVEKAIVEYLKNEQDKA